MPRRHSAQSVRRYHDRVAARYDSIYDDPFWEFHDRITWNHLKPFLPSDPAAPVMDLGCGTGKWGLKLLKAGFPLTFTDISPKMLEEVKRKLAQWKQQADLAAKAARAAVIEADAVDLQSFPPDHFALILAMGDVVSICADAAKCLAEVFRLLRPGGIFIFTVDNHLAAIDHFIDSGNLDALAEFIQTGRTRWLTKNVDERFPLRMFTPREIDALARSRGFEVISRIGKTIIPARRNRKLLENPRAVERLVELESILQRDSAAAARASHLQIAARRPA